MKIFSNARLLDEKFASEMNKFFNKEETTQQNCDFEPPSVENFILPKSNFHIEEEPESIEEIENSVSDEHSEILAENSLVQSPPKPTFMVNFVIFFSICEKYYLSATKTS